MAGSHRVVTLSHLCGGALALVTGILIIVTMVLHLAGAGAAVLGAWISHVTLFAEPDPVPIPVFEFFWPSLGLVGGITLFLVGWTLIIRGAALAWPSRFDRSAS